MVRPQGDTAIRRLSYCPGYLGARDARTPVFVSRVCGGNAAAYPAYPRLCRRRIEKITRMSKLRDPFRTLDDPDPLPVGAVQENRIADGAVQENRIAAGAITTARLMGVSGWIL